MEACTLTKVVVQHDHGSQPHGLALHGCLLRQLKPEVVGIGQELLHDATGAVGVDLDDSADGLGLGTGERIEELERGVAAELRLAVWPPKLPERRG